MDCHVHHLGHVHQLICGGLVSLFVEEAPQTSASNHEKPYSKQDFSSSTFFLVLVIELSESSLPAVAITWALACRQSHTAAAALVPNWWQGEGLLLWWQEKGARQRQDEQSPGEHD